MDTLSTTKKVLISLGVILALVFLYVWSTYNSLVSKNEGITGQWAQVETQYQRRFDLIPNLVESVKGAMVQEKEVFLSISEARTRYAGSVTINAKAAAATQVEGALARLLAVIENYPNLKSIDTVQTLMVQLEGTENRVSVERGRYNEAVKSFNVSIKRFPARLVAEHFDFTEKNYFEAEAGSEKAPKVEFK
jgi:LemA protein